jgi:hypothetical protein
MRAKPVTIDGVTFRWQREDALHRQTWIDDDSMLRVRAYDGDGPGYEASVGFRYIMGVNPQKPKRFHTRDAAMRAAIKDRRWIERAIR